MPTIIDDEGVREADDRELAAIYDEADARWNAFRDALVWRPIADYDRQLGRPELLRLGDRIEFGFWGPSVQPFHDDAEPDPGPAWRHAQDALMEVRLGFEPEEFAVVDDEAWRVALAAG